MKLLPIATIAVVTIGLATTFAAQRADRTLDEIEATHLTFMRSEEKLARDVYLTLAARYAGETGAEVFTTIAEGSEQTHTDAVRDMLAIYGLEDPNPDADDLPASIGVFVDGEYAWYFQEKFQQLTELGSIDLLSALRVGAFIEELDMNDIILCPKVILEMEEQITGDVCGLEYTDEKSLQTLYAHLVDGSENHLRAFVKNIEAITGSAYEAQVLTQEQVDAILGR